MAKLKYPLLIFGIFFVAGLLIFSGTFGRVILAPETPAELQSETEAPAETPVPSDVSPMELDPLTAEVPSLCGHPAGRLVEGALPQDASRLGDTYVRRYPAGQIMWATPQRPLLQTDVIAAVLAVGCNKGGVSWPDTILAYNQSAELIGHITLDSVTGGSREALNSLSVENERVSASWTTEAKGDHACCGTILASSTFTVDGPNLTAGDIDIKNEEQSMLALLAAVNDGDEATAIRHINDEKTYSLLLKQVSYGPLELSRCYGLLNSYEMPASAKSLFKQTDASGNVVFPPSDDIVRICVVESANGKTIVFGYAQPNIAQWVVRLILS